jgi:hypothetical protein
MGKRAKKARTAKPMDPVEVARLAAERRSKMRHPANWGANEPALFLPANADVKSEEATRERVRRIERYDCFALLKSRGSIDVLMLATVRRLEMDLAVRNEVAGAADTSGPGMAQDGLSGGGLAQRRLEAAERLDDVLSKTGSLSAKVLLALVGPGVLNGTPVNNWRNVVKQATGETYDHGQVALVKCACANLVAAYEAHDNTPKRERRVA